MKTLLTIIATAFLTTGAFASAEHCVTRNVIANYANGSGVSTQCFTSESGYKAPTPDKCDYRK